MFWNKNDKKSSLPDLPPMNAPSKIKSSDFQRKPFDSMNSDNEKHTLPSFPDSPISKGFSQAAIKDAIDEESEPSNQKSGFDNPIEREITSSSNSIKTIEMGDEVEKSKMHASIISDPPTTPKVKIPIRKIQETPQETIQETPRESIKIQKTQPLQPLPAQTEKNSDIFVKIEKFRTSRRTLSEVDERIDHINEMLKKIREVRLREEQELTNWEREIATAKAQIENVTSGIFEKID